MRDARAENLLQWVYAYAILILGAVAVGTSVSQAGGTTIVDTLLAKPPGHRNSVRLQETQACSIVDSDSTDKNSCSAESGSNWQEQDVQGGAL